MPTYRSTRPSSRQDYIFEADNDKLAIKHLKEKYPNGGITLYTSTPNGIMRVRKLGYIPKVENKS